MKKQRSGNIYFRADGHAKMGLGHVIRSLALAEMLMEDFDCHFIIRNPLPSLKVQILEVCKSITELPETDDHNAEARMLADKYLGGEEIVLLDGYHFRTEYQRIIKNTGCKLVCIDDIHAYHFVADVVINHAPGLKRSDYSVEKYTNLCLGLEYSLLRKPFLEAATQSRSITKLETLFLCFGGSDFNNITLKSLQALSKLNNGIKKVHVILGNANPFKEEIESFTKTIKFPEIDLHLGLSAREMVVTMKESDIAIVPASSILYEVLAVKMPVISGYYVDNQVGVYNGFKNLGVIYGIGDLNHFENYIDLIKRINVQEIKNDVLDQERYKISLSKNNFLQLFKSLAGHYSHNLSKREAF